MPVFIDLTNRRFGRLTVTKRHPENNKNNRIVWECICDCGNECLVSGANIGRSTKSCGCFAQENRVTSNIKHGKRHSRIYYVWCSIIQRCTNMKAQGYKGYGAQGITICDEWKSFANFLRWAEANGYDDSLSIDRTDNKLGYSPENCKWKTMKQQQNNRTNNRLLTLNGNTFTVAQWAEQLNINPRTLETRLLRGWSIEKALTVPVDTQRRNQIAK